MSTDRSAGRALLALAAGAALALPALADTGSRGSDPTPREDAKRPDPVRLHGIDWHRDLPRALELAGERSTARRPRAVLWLRMLGDLAGDT